MSDYPPIQTMIQKELLQLERYLYLASFAVIVCYMGSRARNMVETVAGASGVRAIQHVTLSESRAHDLEHRVAKGGSVLAGILVMTTIVLALILYRQDRRLKHVATLAEINKSRTSSESLHVMIRDVLESAQYDRLLTNRQIMMGIESRLQASRLETQLAIDRHLRGMNHTGHPVRATGNKPNISIVRVHADSPSPPANTPQENCPSPLTKEEITRLLIEGEQKNYRRIFVPGRGWLNPSKLREELINHPYDWGPTNYN